MGRKCNTYLDRNVNIESFVKSIQRNLQNDDYKIELTKFSRDSFGTNLGYMIRLEKNSKFRKIIGAREKFEITIEGNPNYLDICVEMEDRGKNILSTTLTSVPVGVMTLGLGTMAAVSANLYSQKRWKNSIWNLINDNIDLNSSA
jgi:hypothetical protein